GAPHQPHDARVVGDRQRLVVALDARLDARDVRRARDGDRVTRRGRLEALEHVARLSLQRLQREAARLAAHHDAIGDDVACQATLDAAHVRRRRGVHTPEPHGRDGLRRHLHPADPLIRRSPSSRIISKMETMPDLSSPPRTLVPSVRITSPSTMGRTWSAGGTVSMWPHSRNGATSGAVPGKWATRLPVSLPTLSPASSTCTLAPMASRMAVSRLATLPSRLETLLMRASSRNSSRTRSLLTARILA